jgi:hypothetical protein
MSVLSWLRALSPALLAGSCDLASLIGSQKSIRGKCVPMAFTSGDTAALGGVTVMASTTAFLFWQRTGPSSCPAGQHGGHLDPFPPLPFASRDVSSSRFLSA